jgi:segregation and condensation protein B
MSLKAKLEAVIYAAEEPVTLNQLAVLFADEALEWRAEQQKAAAEAEASKRSSAAELLPMLARNFDYLEPEQSPEAAVESVESAVPDATIAAPTEAQTVAGDSSDVDRPPATEDNPLEETPTSESSNASPDASPDENPGLTPEEAQKQATRQRDREVRLVIRELLDELVDDYATDGSGIEIREIAGGYRMATKPEYHDAVRSFVKSLKPAMKLSLPALETLAVIAYKQPVTAPEVNEIRGVESSGVFGSLLARKLIATAGRKPVVGRPILYKTTKEFLLRFGLNDLSELPSMEEFEKMAASEFEEAETAGQEPESPAAEASEQDHRLENAEEPGTAQNAEETSAADAAPETARTVSEQAAEKFD